MGCAVFVQASRREQPWRVSLPSSKTQLPQCPWTNHLTLPHTSSRSWNGDYNPPQPCVLAKYAKHLMFQKDYELLHGLGARLTVTCARFISWVFNMLWRWMCLSVTNDAAEQSPQFSGQGDRGLRVLGAFLGRGNMNLILKVHLKLVFIEILTEFCIQMQFIEREGNLRKAELILQM